MNSLIDIFDVGKFDYGVVVRYQNLMRKPEHFPGLLSPGPPRPGPGYDVPLNPPLAGLAILDTKAEEIRSQKSLVETYANELQTSLRKKTS